MKYRHIEQATKQRIALIEDYQQSGKDLADSLMDYLRKTAELQKMGINTENDEVIEQVFKCFETLEKRPRYDSKLFDYKIVIRLINQARK